MIKKAAIDEYKRSKQEDHDWIKKLSEEDLDEILATEFDPIPQFHTRPFKHQKACFILGYFTPEFLFFLDLGTGKTKLVLDLLSYKKQCGEEFEALVCVPNIGNIGGWEDEIWEHAPKLIHVPVMGTREQKEEILQGYADIFIINYPSLVSTVTKKVDVEEHGRGSFKKLKIEKKLLRPLKKKFKVIIFDESTVIKNIHSLAYKACNQLARECDTVYSLTGYPFGRDPIDLWAQFNVVDKGETLGRTLGFFREVFMENVANYWTDYKYELKSPEKKKRLHHRLKNRSIYYNEKECGSLPKKVYIKKRVKFPTDSHIYYAEILEQMRQYAGDMKKVKGCFVRMRQITSGYITYEDNRQKLQFKFAENPKMEALEEILEGLPENSKAIVVHEFTYTGTMICELLKSMKIGHVWLYGGTKDKIKTIKSFQKNKMKKIMVMNHKSGAFGLNLQVANYVILVESPVSPIVRKQVEKRAHRTGSKKKRVFFIDILLRNSVDDSIVKFLKEGKNLYKELIRGKVKL